MKTHKLCTKYAYLNLLSWYYKWCVVLFKISTQNKIQIFIYVTGDKIYIVLNKVYIIINQLPVC